ncbi:MAG: CpsD/CapB family tyrosine-protein kinase [Clostridia bacterium]|nr:CpsD/CapB family tyrosine-protein kinase [Clostridia bacterium]
MRKELLTYKDPKSPVSEVFRTLRTNIQFMSTNKKLKTLLVTSTFPEEGKSWVTANLAVTFAQAGKNVLLIDADMRKGRQYKIFDVLPKPGLSNYLSSIGAEDEEVNDVNIANYIQATGVENLHVLVAGNVPPNPSELLVSSKMRDLLRELKEMCDIVIIDGTPCDLVTDSIILSRFVDSTIIVTAQKETKKEALQRITKNIQNVGGRIAGVVVNKVDMSSKKYKQSYYYGSISGRSLNNKDDKKHKKEFSFGNIFKGSDDEKDYSDIETDDESERIIESEKNDNIEELDENETREYLYDEDNNAKTERDLEIEKLVKSIEEEEKREAEEQSRANNEIENIVSNYVAQNHDENNVQLNQNYNHNDNNYEHRHNKKNKKNKKHKQFNYVQEQYIDNNNIETKDNNKLNSNNIETKIDVVANKPVDISNIEDKSNIIESPKEEKNNSIEIHEEKVQENASNLGIYQYNDIHTENNNFQESNIYKVHTYEQERKLST